MITHLFRLTTRFQTACLLTLFLLTLPLISPAQQPTNTDVHAIIKEVKDKDAAVRSDAARGLVLSVLKAPDHTLVEAASPALIEALKDPDSSPKPFRDGAQNSME